MESQACYFGRLALPSCHHYASAAPIAAEAAFALHLAGYSMRLTAYSPTSSVVSSPSSYVVIVVAGCPQPDLVD